MIARHAEPLTASPNVAAPPNGSARHGSGAVRVSDATYLNELLPILSAGAEHLEVIDERGAVTGRVTAGEVFAALTSSKGYSHAS
jgi:CBS-domain-containing membrane protein